MDTQRHLGALGALTRAWCAWASGLAVFAWVVLGCCASAWAMPPISVQVQQDVWRLVDAPEGRVEVAITVANPSSLPLDGALLVLPEPAASALLDSAVPLTQHGDGLAWPIGKIASGDRAVLKLTFQADAEGVVVEGPRLYASLAGSPLVLQGRAVRVEGPALPTEYLAVTPDADPSDPPIVHQAALLGNDPARIFQFVQEETVLQPYRGSLQGARGALYGLGGNPHDRANLLVALLRASGIPAGYRFGALSEAELDRLGEEFFPDDAATDRTGRALSVEALRQDPARLLSLLPPRVREGLGDTRDQQLAGLASWSDEDLGALVFEGRALDPAHREALRDHAWVEAWIGGRWVPMDPTWRGAQVGELGATPSAPLTASMPDAMRHRVSLYLFHEAYQPVWGLGRPELRPPVLQLTRGAGDLVGRAVTAYSSVREESQSGFFFYSKTTTYTPGITLRDLERVESQEEHSAQPFDEFVSNFAGPLVNQHVTSIWLGVELLAPGQAPGEGELVSRALADRFPQEVRLGLGFEGDTNFSEIVTDTMDVATVLIGAPNLPTRPARAAQELLRLDTMNLAQTNARLEAEGNPDSPPLDPELLQVRNYQRDLTTAMISVMSSNLGERQRLMAQSMRQRPFSSSPRIVMSLGQVRSYEQGGGRMTIDLVRDRIESLGAPGQFRGDRLRMMTAYGMAATSLEGSVLEAFSGGPVVHTDRVFQAAADLDIPTTFLFGQQGLQRLERGEVTASARGMVGLRDALLRGVVILAPVRPVTLDGRSVTAWLELDPEGGAVGRLEDGSGGALLEYAFFAYEAACNYVLSCPEAPDERSLIQMLALFNARLWGLIAASVDGAFACSGGNQSVCDKLQTSFPMAYNEALDKAFEELQFSVEWEWNSSNCVEYLPSLPTAATALEDLEIECPGCDEVLDIIEGMCEVIKAFKESYDIIHQALADPLLVPRPMGVVDADPSDPRERNYALASRQITATRTPGPLRGEAYAQHARVGGDLEVSWDADLAQTVKARLMRARGASLVGEEGTTLGAELGWAGGDFPLVVSQDAHLELGGVGEVDLYAGALSSGVAGMGTFGDPMDLGTFGYDLAVMDGAVTLDLHARPTPYDRLSGVLAVGGEAQEAGVYEASAPTISVHGAFAGPLGAGAARFYGLDGSLAWSQAQGTLTWGDAPWTAGDGQGFLFGGGNIEVAQGDARGDRYTLDLEDVHGLEVRLVPVEGPSYGPFVFRAEVLTSLAGEYVVEALAPDRWTASWEGDLLTLTPGARVANGDYEVQVRASHARGLGASTRAQVSFEMPDSAVASLEVEPDVRNSVDLGGARVSAWLVSLGHFGPQDGVYELSVSLDRADMVAELSATDAMVRPGERRRVGLTVRPRDLARGWPAPGPMALTVEARGSANVSRRFVWEVPQVASVDFDAEPPFMVVVPGERFEAQIRVRSTGNVAAAPSFVLDLPPGLTGSLAAAPASLAPGQEVSLALSLQALPGQELALPVTAPVVVSLPATAFEQERGLTPRRAVVQVTVATPGTESMIELYARAAREGDAALMQEALDTFSALMRATLACDEERAASLRRRLEALASLLEERFDADDVVAALRERASRLEVQECVALSDPQAPLLGEEDFDFEALKEGANLVASFQAPAESRNGDQVALRLQVVNAGDAPSVPARGRLDARGANGVRAVGAWDVPGLEPGARHEVEATWDTTLDLGRTLLSWKVELVGEGEESTLSDNQLDVAVTVLPTAVAPVGNGAPVFQGEPQASVALGVEYRFSPAVRDPDGDPVFLALEARPRGLSLVDGALVGKFYQTGSWPVVLKALDRYGASATLEFELSVVLPSGNNAAPVVSSRPSRRTWVGRAWSYRPVAVDPEEGAVAWSLVEGPVAAGWDGREVAWTPAEGDVGRAWFHLRATDEEGKSAEHRFSVEVAAGPRGPDLAVVAVDPSGLTDEEPGTRSGRVRVDVANVGETASAATEVVAFEERDGATGLGQGDGIRGRARIGALNPGQSASVNLTLRGEVGFPNNIVFAQVDPDGLVTELDEANNVRFSGQASDPDVYAYGALRPVPADLFLVAQRPTAWRALDPATGSAVAEGVLEALVPQEVDLGELDRFVLEADGPLQAYMIHEIYDPDFGADLFHPDVTGQKVGREFVLFVPTLTPNNQLILVAVQDAQVSVEDVDGQVLAQVNLGAGQPWEPLNLEARAVYRVRSTGDVVIQSSSVTGMSVVPPAERAAASRGDVGRSFLFSVRSRGPGGGAVAVLGYDDEPCDYAVTTLDGQSLARGRVRAGEVRFHGGLGEHAGLRLEATGRVSVWAGDIARPGAARVELMGEDQTLAVGDAGTELWVHTLAQQVGDTVILAGPQGALVSLDGGEPIALDAYGALTLEDGGVLHLQASAPVQVQAQGGGDRSFDMGDVLRVWPQREVAPRVLVSRVSIDASMCAQRVPASARVGNAGNGPLPSGARVELVERDPQGERVTASATLPALAPGMWADVSLVGLGSSSSSQRAWSLRVTGEGAGEVWAEPAGGPVQARCENLAPEFVSTPPTQAREGEVLVYVAQARDPEGEAVRYALANQPGGASLDAARGVLRWSPPAGVRLARFGVIATDPQGGLAFQSFDVAVEPRPVGCGVGDPDADGDGFCASQDCDEARAEVSPARAEVLGDGLDNDCSPLTPDMVPQGGASLMLTPNASIYAHMDPVVLLAQVQNRGELASLVGLEVSFEVSCNGAREVLFDERVLVPALGPQAEGLARAVWPLDGSVTGSCEARAELWSGTARLARAEASFEVRAGVTGEIHPEPAAALPGEPLTLAWTLVSASPRPADEAVEVRLDGLGVVDAQVSSLVPGEPFGGQTLLDTQGWLPGLYTARLFVGRTQVASTTARLTKDARLEAVWAEGDAPNLGGAPREAIELRPLGPQPGGLTRGGELRGGWSPDALHLWTDLYDEVEDAGDGAELRLADAQGVVRVVARWTVADGLSVEQGEGVEVSVSALPRGRRLAWTIPAQALGGLTDEGRLALLVSLRDGTQERLVDAWLWARDAQDPAEVSAWGEVTLAARPTEEPDAGMDADAEMDVEMDMEMDTEMDVEDEPDAQPDVPEDVEQDVAPDVEQDVAPDVEPDVKPDVAPEEDVSTDDDLPSQGDGGGEDVEEPTTVDPYQPKGGCDCQVGPRRSDGGWGWVLLGVVAWRLRAGLRGRASQGGRGSQGAWASWFLVGLALAFLAACGSDREAGGGAVEVVEDAGDDDAQGDAGPDEPDAEQDAAPDAEPDVKEDPKEDPDAEPDAEQDAEQDAAPDVEPDAEPDVEPDAEQDAQVDVVEDVEADVEPDAEQDVAQDARPDAEPDVEPDFEEPTGGIGELCTQDGDCRSGICLSGGDFALCTRGCEQYDCPEGWTCEQYVGGRVCVPARVCLDEDGDGFGQGRDCAGVDCDEQDADVYAGAEEACDGVDNDCDGLTDEGLLNACGACGPLPIEVCDGFDNDCDGEADESLRNACGGCGAVPTEVCDLLDNDCDGQLDEDGVCAGCVEGAMEPCFPGDEDLAGVGLCAVGARVCLGGELGACEGAVLPQDELCDGLDNDCDGEVDEGVLNACGACGAAPLEICDEVDNDCDGQVDEGIESACGGCEPCGQVRIFPGEQGERDPALSPAPDGALTIGTGVAKYDAIWVPNSDEDTFSRFSTTTGREIGRYWVGENPSRTSVDLNGNAWVTNRGDGKATHVFYNRSDCVDRNGDGVIQTSQDFNGDGRITGGELIGTAQDPLADECVHCQVQTPRRDEWLRGVGVDADNYAWLGAWNTPKLFKVDPNTCEIVQEIPMQNSVYGIAIDGDGILWTSSFTGNCVAKVDTRTGEVLANVCNNTTRYGVAVDGQGTLWYADYGGGLLSYNPDTQTWAGHAAPNSAVRSSTGVVADTQGNIYVAGYDNHTITKYNFAENTWRTFDVRNVPPGELRQSTPRGVTIDADGNIWGICRDSSGLIKLSPELEFLGSYPIVSSSNPDRGTGPYSYSDNTGFQLFNYTAREGYWRQVFDAGANVEFARLTWQAYLPEGDRVEVRVRAATERDGLGAQPWSEWTEARDVALRGLVADPARYLEMQFHLVSQQTEDKVVLRDVQVYFVTPDCREEPCPDGQLCDQRTGACLVQPRECGQDGACLEGEFCDSTGLCRPGCRLEPDSCPQGEACDEDLRICVLRQSDCALDNQCAGDQFCDDGYCTVGCRTLPDSCPPRMVCEPQTHRCEPLPAECAVDADCPDDEHCGDDGFCLVGCRLGQDTCDVDQAPSAQGFLRQWLLLGPITLGARPLDTNLLTVPDDGQATLAYGEDLSAEAGPVTLFESATDYVNLLDAYGGSNDRVAYAMTWVESPIEQTLELGLGTDDSARVWFGPAEGPLTEVYRHDGIRGAVPEQGRARVQLQAGLNRLLIKVHTNYGGWGLYARFLRDGVPAQDLRVKLDARMCDPDTRVCALPAPGCDMERAGPEVCDGLDNDCDGVIDDAPADVGLTCTAGTEAPGQTVCAWGRPMCKPTLPDDPQVDVRLTGTLTNVLLGAGRYALTANVSFQGLLVVEPGATVSTVGGVERTLTQGSGAVFDARGATFEGVALRLGGTSTARIEGCVLRGIPNSDLTLYHNLGTLSLLDSQLTNLTLDTTSNSQALVEGCQFDATDNRERWMGTIRGKLRVKDSELVGLNLVPRRQHGLALYHPAEVVVEDSTLSRLQRALWTNSGSAITVERNVFEDPEVAFQVEGGARPVFADNTISGLDLALSTTGVEHLSLAVGAGGLISQTRFLLEPSDVGFVLDPDFFGVGTEARIEGSAFERANADRQYHLSGRGDSAELRFALFDQANQFFLADHVTLYGASNTFADGLRVSGARPTYYGFYAAGSSRVTATNVAFHDVWWEIQANATLTLTGGSVTQEFARQVHLLHVYGNLVMSGTRLEGNYRSDNLSTNPDGVVLRNSGRAMVMGATFRNLRYGVFLESNSAASIVGTTFDSCSSAVWAQNAAKLEPLSQCLIRDTDDAFTSNGIELRFTAGGRADVSGITFDVGPEDFTLTVDPDCFREGSASTFGALTYTDGEEGQGLRIFGEAIGGVILLTSILEDQPLWLRQNLVFKGGAQVTLASGLTLASEVNTYYAVYTQEAGTHLVAEPGVTFQDLGLAVQNTSTATLNQTDFTSTNRNDRDMVDVYGTLTANDCTWTGFERVQNGVRVRAGGLANISGGIFSELDWGADVYRGGTFDAQDTIFEGNEHAVWIDQSGTLSLDACQIRDTVPNRLSVGIETYDPRAGIVVTMRDTAFDLGPEDLPFQVSLDALGFGNTYDLSGSTFARGELGLGYRLNGTLATTNTVNLRLLEPAQPAWVLYGSVYVRQQAVLTIAPGTVLRGQTSQRLLQAYETGRINASSATFERVTLEYRGTSTGTASACTFRTDLAGTINLTEVDSTGAVTFQSSRFEITNPQANAVRGAYVYGGATVVPTYQDNAFEGLRYGVYIERGGALPNLVNNTFNQCVEATYRRP